MKKGRYTMKKWLEEKRALSLILLTVTPLLLLVLAFTWESTGDSPLNLLIPHQQLWGGENLSNSASSEVSSFAPEIATGGGTEVYVVWRENWGSNAEIYFKRSTDGAIWPSGTGTSLTDNEPVAMKRFDPAIAVENGVTLHVVWEDQETETNRDILYRKSANGGDDWSPHLGIGATGITTDTTYEDKAPDVAVSGTVPYVVWYGDRNGDNYEEIHYSKNDGGVWTAPDTVSVSTKPSKYPAIASSGGRLHVTWDVLTTTAPFVYSVEYRRSTDGDTWIDLMNVSGDVAGNTQPTHPDVAARGNDVYVVWNTLVAVDTYQVRCRRSDDGGNSWLPATTIATPTTSWVSPYPAPRVTVDITGTVHVVWHGTGSDSEIWYSSSENNGANWSTPTNLSNESLRGSWLASVALDGSNQVHVVWQEEYQDNSDDTDIYWIRTDLAGSGGIYLPIIMKNH